MPAPDRTAGEGPDKSPGSARARSAHTVRRETSAPAGQYLGEGRARRHGLDRQPERYMVAADPPTEPREFAAQLDQDPQIRVVRTIGRMRAGDYPVIAVVETTPERAAALSRMAALRVEPDTRLGWDGMPAMGLGAPADVAVAPVGDVQPVVVAVDDDGGRPVEGAAVGLFGHGLPAIGFTGPDGRAELAAPVETAVGAELLVVRPARGCWPARVSRPRLVPGEPVRISCERVITTFPDFPERALDSWGARAMGFDRLPPTHRGDGIRIALIDSGVASGHPDLANRIADGRDVVGEDDKSWREDPIGTGTHQAVLIAGRDDGSGVIGLAPEAELHVCRTAPGGTCADLIEALDYCIAQEIDVALISVGAAHASALLAEKVLQARRNGVACVAAAGDSAGPIAQPAALPGVLAVGAIGRIGSFPPDSGMAAELTGPPTPDGFFVPRFANHGPGIDCCAPGVAIVSGLPPASYGPLGGTAIAAAHVAAVAGLVLAHHPQFRPQPGRPPVIRDGDRTDRLFQQILASCRPLPELGPIRSGAGIPDAAIAVGVAPRGSRARLPGPAFPPSAASAGPRADEELTQAALADLEAAMRAAGLVSGATRGA
jgi:subtilisin family serine protease